MMTQTWDSLCLFSKIWFEYIKEFLSGIFYWILHTGNACQQVLCNGLPWVKDV